MSLLINEAKTLKSFSNFRCFSVVIWLFLFNTEVFSQVSKCNTQTTCSSCIQAGSHCAWCNDENLPLTSLQRCDDYGELKNKCPNKIVYPESKTEILEEAKLGKSGQRMVQLTPQVISIKLRPNSRQNIKVNFQEITDYPMDLYYLMDLSFSMRDDLQKLLSLGRSLGETTRSITKDFQLGFGSFVDKTVLPYVEVDPVRLNNPCSGLGNHQCASPYGFLNKMPLTNLTERFLQGIKDSRISGNVDLPEGSLDAMMQAIVCGKEIGWRTKARKILLVATDAGFHIAGDGKLGGIIVPNDGLCHLDSTGGYTESTKQDYPSIHHINKKVQENNINVIFAVTERVQQIYNDVNEIIEGSRFGKLMPDSSNIVDLIREQYKKITSTVVLKDNSTNFLEVTYEAKCVEGQKTRKQTSKCEGMPVGGKAEFNIGIELTKCPESKDDRRQILEISPVGLSEKVIINLDLICECECEATSQGASIDRCNGKGTFECSICNCDEGRFGEQCECDTQMAFDYGDDTPCKRENSSIVCSGRGQCTCGKCLCNKLNPTSNRFYGKFCECDNFNCAKHNGLLCGGNGDCDCGQCKCFPKFKGSTCECPSTEENCIGATGEVCKGNGKCECGNCKCISPYGGKFCEENLTPGGKCIEYRTCAQCLGFPEYSSSNQEICGYCNMMFSGNVVPILEELGQGEHKCQFLDKNGCIFFFTYNQFGNTSLPVLAVQQIKVCSEPVNLLLVIGTCLGAVFLIGILALILWKIITYYKDKIEYEKFMKESSDPKWVQNQNPLFRKPVQRFSNPVYGRINRITQRFSRFRIN